MKPKVYMSIPITGRDIEQVKKELLEVSKAIAAKGWEPVSPLDGVEDYSLPWEEYILRDLQVLRKCNGVIRIRTDPEYLSNGVFIENAFASGINIPITTYSMLRHDFEFLTYFEKDLINNIKNQTK